MEMKKKLAIICADTFQKKLVNKAKEMGIETHCFSWDKEGYTQCKGIADYFHSISILEKEQILLKCREIKIDGVTSVNNVHAIPTVAYVAENMRLPGNRYEDMLIALHKFTMRKVFAEHGVKSPRFAMVYEEINLPEFQYPVIAKVIDDNCDAGIIKVEKEEDLQEAIREAYQLSVRKEVIIEEFIEGVEAGVDIISWNGEHHIVAIKEREVIINEEQCPQKIAEHYPFELPDHIQDKIVNETKKALNAINFKNGVSKAEFRITTSGEVYIIEINPRFSSHFVLKLHNGYDLLKGHIDVALGQFEKPIFTHKKYSGRYTCKENTGWLMQVIENKDNDPDIVEAVLYNDNKLQGGRKGYFIYQSKQRRRWNPEKK